MPAAPSSQEELRFCFFGRLAANKGLAEFLMAFAKVAHESGAILDIHGAGPERAHLEALVSRLRLQDRVKLCGHYPGGSAYAQLLSSYHCLILPSRGYEGLPLVLIEAMSCGLPFLATNIGAIPEAATGNKDVVLMSPDEEGMCAGIRECARKLRQGLISRARLREYYQQHFSPEVFEASWRTMLRSPRSFFA